MEKSQNSVDNIIRCLDEIKSEVQFLSVKPKDEPEVPLGTRKTIDGDPCVYVHVANPCDALTRQHLAEIENEKLFTGKYEPTMIPGCPADKKRKEM
jgi:hypothetical protein